MVCAVALLLCATALGKFNNKGNFIMGVAEALALLAQVMASAVNLMANAQQISALVQTAQSQGRTTFTPDEWATIQGIDTAARQLLVAQITAALSK